MLRINVIYLFTIIMTFVLTYLLSAIRWKVMADPFIRLSVYQSLKLIGAANSLNMILPSKMGNFIKAYAIFSNGAVKTKPAISMVIYEKLLDMATMCVLFLVFTFMGSRYNLLILFNVMFSACMVLLLICMHIFPRNRIFDNIDLKRSVIKNWLAGLFSVVLTYARSDEFKQAGIIKIYLITTLICVTHSIQLILFFHMLGLHIPSITILSNMYGAIFIGLIPITIAGIGTRDLAIVYLFNGILTYSESLSIGIVITMRYLVPMILGFPFFMAYVFSKNQDISFRSYLRGT